MLNRMIRRLLALGVLALGWHVMRSGELEGSFLGIPYDLRPPTLSRLRERLWNPAEQRLIVPTPLGWGYTVNLYRVARLGGLVDAVD